MSVSGGDLITVQEAAKRAGVTRQAIELACDTGRLSLYEVLGRKAIDPAELEKYIKNPTYQRQRGGL